MGTPRVFLLDDDPVIARIVEAAVAREGWLLTHAAKLAGALDAALAFAPDALIIDVQLPDGDGFSFCAACRAHPALSTVPALFLTGVNDVDSRLRAFSIGAQDYIPKPFAAEELLARLRAHLRLKAERDHLKGEKEAYLIRERLSRDMSDMIVHDLRAPLATVKATLSLILDEGLIENHDYQRLMKNAEFASDFAIMMVSDLLDLKEGRLRVNAEPTDVGDLLGRVRDCFSARFQMNGVALRLRPREEHLVATLDAAIIFRILVNLLENALKYGRSGGRVEFGAEASGSVVIFEVRDYGEGIPDSVKTKIFEKFFRTDTAKDGAAPGFGIGLAFCRLAAGELGGRIWVEDGVGGGSRFMLEIPRTRPITAKAKA